MCEWEGKKAKGQSRRDRGRKEGEYGRNKTYTYSLQVHSGIPLFKGYLLLIGNFYSMKTKLLGISYLKLKFIFLNLANIDDCELGTHEICMQL